MAQEYQLPSAKAESAFCYRFVCEHCGRQTQKQVCLVGDPIYSYTGEQKQGADTDVHIAIAKGEAISQGDLDRLRMAAVKKLHATIEKMKAKAAKDTFSATHFGGKCPACGKRQS